MEQSLWYSTLLILNIFNGKVKIPHRCEFHRRLFFFILFPGLTLLVLRIAQFSQNPSGIQSTSWKNRCATSKRPRVITLKRKINNSIINIRLEFVKSRCSEKSDLKRQKSSEVTDCATPFCVTVQLTKNAFVPKFDQYLPVLHILISQKSPTSDAVIAS